MKEMREEVLFNAKLLVETPITGWVKVHPERPEYPVFPEVAIRAGIVIQITGRRGDGQWEARAYFACMPPRESGDYSPRPIYSDYFGYCVVSDSEIEVKGYDRDDMEKWLKDGSSDK